MRHSASRKRHGRRKASTAFRRRRLLLLPALMLSLVLGLPSGALAFWTATGAGSGGGATGTLLATAAPTVSSTSGSNSAAITWTTSATSGVTGYRVQRSPSTGAAAWTAVCGTATAPIAAAGTCTDTGIADGSYIYRVVALKGSWTAPSAVSAIVTIARDVVAPTVTVERVTAQYTKAATLQFRAKFSERVFGFDQADVVLNLDLGINGSAAISVAPDGSSTTDYIITINGLSGSTALTAGGAVRVTIPAGVAVDIGGNGNTVSTGTTNFVILDNSIPVKPALPHLDSDSGRSSTDRITNVTEPIWSGNAGMAEVGSTVTLSRWAGASGGTAVATATGVVLADGSYSIKAPVIPNNSMADGVTHYFSVHVADQAGNVGAESDRQTMVLDVTAPAVSITARSGLLGNVSVSGVRGITSGDLASGTTASPAGQVTVVYCRNNTSYPCSDRVVATDRAIAGTTSAWSAPNQSTTVLGLEAVYVYATQVDAAGNIGRTATRGFGLLGPLD